MDQRGALRSQRLAPNERLNLLDIIEDCEALRRRLRIDQWSLLGHSLGGLLAVRYALAYPSVIARLILECPALDVLSSYRSLLRGAAAGYRALGDAQSAALCLTGASSQRRIRRPDRQFSRLSIGLGPRHDRLYVHRPSKNGFRGELVAAAGLPRAVWRQDPRLATALFSDGDMLESVVPLLGRLECSTLLVKGRYDWVASDDQVMAFRKHVRRGRVAIFQKSAHFPHFEEPARFASVVTTFLLEAGR